MRTIVMLAATVCLAGTAAASNLPRRARYVSMGSSYAAGPGVGTPDPASGGCARSRSNYAREVAARRHLELVDVACSGATTDNILAHGQHGFPPQIEAVTPETRLVTILIGGNDVAYVSNLMGLTCRDAGGSRCDVMPDAEVDRRLAALPGVLRAMIDAVRARAPGARIVLVGYLPALPVHGTCDAVPLTPEDAARMRSVSARLATLLNAVAAQTGASLVRASAIGVQHDACSATPYLAGAHPKPNPAWPAAVPFHPNQSGMDRVADAIDELLRR